MVVSGRTLYSDYKSVVSPFHPRTVENGMSYGLSYAGYDVRIAQDVTLWPGLCRLASTVERFELPANLLGIVHDKSTWARRGVTVQNTVLEPGWEGWLTLELVLHHWKPLRIKAGSPIAQIVFHVTDKPCVKYAGKYNHQPNEPVPAILEGSNE